MGWARATEEACITKRRDHGEMKLLLEAGGGNLGAPRGPEDKGSCALGFIY